MINAISKTAENLKIDWTAGYCFTRSMEKMFSFGNADFVLQSTKMGMRQPSSKKIILQKLFANVFTKMENSNYDRAVSTLSPDKKKIL